jgi:hypothetical protein
MIWAYVASDDMCDVEQEGTWKEVETGYFKLPSRVVVHHASDFQIS